MGVAKLRRCAVDKPGMRGVSSITLLVLLATAGCADAQHFMPALRTALAGSKTTSTAGHAVTSSRGSQAAAQPGAEPAVPAERLALGALSTTPVQPQALPSGAIDMSGVLRDAVRLPQDVQRLRQAIVTGLVIVSVLGTLNAVLMLAVLGRLRTLSVAPKATSAPLPAGAPSTAAPARAPLSPALVGASPTMRYEPLANTIASAAGATAVAVRTCACGAEISARSRTGRCRSCARNAAARAKRTARLSDIPAGV